MTETLQINDHVVAIVLKSSYDTESPLKWDPVSDRAQGFGIATIACPAGLRHTYPTMQWQKEFIKLATSSAVQFDQILDHVRAESVDVPGYTGTREWNGHQQGEWMTVLISGPTEEAAESYYQTWATWARGDVYDVRIERKCPITNSWFTPEDDEPISNFYKEPSRPLEESVRELVEREFEVNARKVCKRGEAILEQSELTSQIHEAKAMFNHVRSSDITESAKNIFDMYEKLVAALEEQIEEL